MQSLEQSTSEVQEWYHKVNQQCLAANERHIELRSAIAALRRNVMRSQIPLYPRPIGSGTSPTTAQAKPGGGGAKSTGAAKR
jgi:hypothetical protein